ncbi:MAG: SdrD B-like domain-containing protein [Gemmatimonadota bacterium]|nr:hypothetical protein [Gemmatimonadota bacterium]
MTRARWFGMRLAALGVAVAAFACQTPETGDILEVQATGTVQGRVYFDANANRREDATDPSVPDIPVQLSVRGSREPVATQISNAQGQYQFVDLPVGSYWIDVDSTVLGDTLFVLDADTARVDVRPGATPTKGVGLSLAKVSIAEARTLPAGKKVTIEGFALNSRTVFGDSTVHLSDGPNAIRTINVFRAGIQQGDSVRLTGRTGTFMGQPVLDGVTTQILATTGTPQPTVVSTASAANAVGGTRDANHVQVRDAVVVDTVTVQTGDRIVRVNDGSGVLEVVFDEAITFNLPWLLPDSVPARLTGVLVPTGTGAWQMKPRSQADIVR